MFDAKDALRTGSGRRQCRSCGAASTTGRESCSSSNSQVQYRTVCMLSDNNDNKLYVTAGKELRHWLCITKHDNGTVGSDHRFSEWTAVKWFLDWLCPSDWLSEWITDECWLSYSDDNRTDWLDDCWLWIWQYWFTYIKKILALTIRLTDWLTDSGNLSDWMTYWLSDYDEYLIYWLTK